MQHNSLPDCPTDSRATARANMFLAAVLHAEHSSVHVKIRDMSNVGAQVESAVLPEVGASVRLVRGSLSVQGEVAWRAAHRCGLKFSSLVSVQHWLANSRDRGQQRVDHIVALVKAGAVPLETTPDRENGVSGRLLEISRISELLRSLGEQLVADDAIVAKYSVQLQNLDIALQSLASLAAGMELNRPESANQSAVDHKGPVGLDT